MYMKLIILRKSSSYAKINNNNILYFLQQVKSIQKTDHSTYNKDKRTKRQKIYTCTYTNIMIISTHYLKPVDILFIGLRQTV